MNDSNYREKNKRQFGRKMLINGMPGFLGYFGQNPSSKIHTNIVYNVTIHNISQNGVGIELILPKERKNHEIEQVRVGDKFKLYYVILKNFIAVPKIEQMQIVNINYHIENETNQHPRNEIIQIGALYLNHKKREDLGFLQTSKIDVRTKVPNLDEFVQNVFGICEYRRDLILPKSMNLEENVAKLGYNLDTDSLTHFICSK